jgi:hypothetical protein
VDAGKRKRPISDPGETAGSPSINICFSTTDAVLSRWIRWFTRSRVSHAVITFRSELLGKVLVMEASAVGFRLLPWAKWEKKNTLVTRFRLDLPEAAQVSALHFIADKLGDEYDRRGLFGFFRVLSWWREKPLHGLPNWLDHPNKLFCSEAVALFLHHAGLDGFERPAQWSPGELLIHAESNPVFIREELGPAAKPTEDGAGIEVG